MANTKAALRSRIGNAVKKNDPEGEADARADLAFFNIIEYLDHHAFHLKVEQFDQLETHIKSLRDSKAAAA